MSIRTIIYQVDGQGISPQGVQNAGLQGEDNATTLVFCLKEDFYTAALESIGDGDELHFRVDIQDGVGGYHASEVLSIDSQTLQVEYSLPKAVTIAGGQCRGYLVVTQVNTVLDTQRVIYSFPARFDFVSTPQGAVRTVQYEKDITGLALQAQRAAQEAQERAEEVAAQIEDAQMYRNQCQTYATNAEFFRMDAQSASRIAVFRAGDAQVAAETAQNYAQNSETASLNAENSMLAAEQYAQQAQAAKTAAETAQGSAEAAAAQADVRANASAEYATEAYGYAYGNGDTVGAKQYAQQAQAAREATESYSKNLFTNALKGQASGAAVAADDVSPVAHDVDVQLRGEDVDLSTVTVKQWGKNMLKYPYYNTTKTENGITFTDNGDGTVTLNGTATADVYFNLVGWLVDCYLPAGQYVLSGCPVGGDYNSSYFMSAYINGAGAFDVGKSALLSVPEGGATWRMSIVVRAGMTVENVVFKPQIQVGSIATDYEPYIEPVEYTPNADGTVEGVTPLYPSMTLTTDNPGAVINCKYNRDINKAFAQLQQAIISLGGNV